MLWNLRWDRKEIAEQTEHPAGKRFVIHRHRDQDGDHIDVRLEQDGYLVGWRVAATEPDGATWATEKMPHPLAWLDADRDATRIDSGIYEWNDRDNGAGNLVLHGESAIYRLHVRRADALSVEGMISVAEAAKEHGLDLTRAANLLRDGVTARQRAVQRLCGLARELDGDAFDEPAWRKSLAGLTLDDVHRRLRAYEVRFDEKYPPQPVSQPVPLSEDNGAGRWEDMLALLRE